MGLREKTASRTIAEVLKNLDSKSKDVSPVTARKRLRMGDTKRVTSTPIKEPPVGNGRVARQGEERPAEVPDRPPPKFPAEAEKAMEGATKRQSHGKIPFVQAIPRKQIRSEATQDLIARHSVYDLDLSPEEPNRAKEHGLDLTGMSLFKKRLALRRLMVV
jgi:hypothetical protein